MIDRIGGRPFSPPAASAVKSGTAEAPKSPATGMRPEAGANLTRIARDLAASPPVDAGKVERLKAAIGAGTYVIDVDAVAAKMIALETPFRA